MEYKASHRFARIAPRKARLVADSLRGKAIDVDITELEYNKRRAAYYFRAVLKSAIANAEEKDADLPRLFISESRVDEGPTMKRWQPKDRGRAHRILKRTSHLHIALEEKN